MIVIWISCFKVVTMNYYANNSMLRINLCLYISDNMRPWKFPEIIIDLMINFVWSNQNRIRSHLDQISELMHGYSDKCLQLNIIDLIYILKLFFYVEVNFVSTVWHSMQRYTHILQNYYYIIVIFYYYNSYYCRDFILLTY